MSNRNDGSSEFAIVAGVMAASAILLIVIFYILGLILAAVMTVIALCAWNRPLTLGNNVVTPEEARFFVYAGIAGACGFSVIVWLVAAMFKIPVDPDAWIHVYLGGYALGSIGLTALAGKEDVFEAPPAKDATPQPGVIAPPPAPPQPEPFRYARWDDEEYPS